MRRVAHLLALVTLAACSENSASVISPDVVEASDRPDAVAPLDLTVVDVPAPQDQRVITDTPDVVAADVVDAPALPDVSDVPPTCTTESCAPGLRCDIASGACIAGCDEDRDCAGASGDGGATSQRCESVSHQCVECVRDEHCPAGFLCVGNLCAAGCNGSRACPAGQSCCGGACVDPQSSTAHCGACGTVCTAANATPACLNGTCGVGRCDPGFASCDGDGANGCEANTLRDTTNCGGCGQRCAPRANSVATCEAGRCAWACEPGFADCDADPANGCEAQLATSDVHCGACGRRCELPNAGARCAGGVCGVTSCTAGFGDCDGSASNGCEVRLAESTSHCGACGAACAATPNAFPGCLAGRCVSSCVTGFVDCDGRDNTGCEVDVRSDLANCGACGRACAPANGTGACAAGRCAVAACSAGFADCDGDAGNGCEVRLGDNPAHCGACGRSCPSGLCREGTCADFGGLWERSDPGCLECNNTNPTVGACGCPGGFGVSTAMRVINDCRGQGTQHGAVIFSCGASNTAEWGGAFQRDDGVGCGQGCRAANPYTGACSCPGGFTTATFRVLTDGPGCGGLIGSSVNLCVPSAPGPRFGGAFQVDDGVAGGVGCRAANPLTGACTCPAGYGAAGLRVQVDSSRGFIGSAIFQCVR
jgi:hypothetical protein